MFKNTFQSGFLSILYSIGSKPLQIWEKQVSVSEYKYNMACRGFQSSSFNQCLLCVFPYSSVPPLSLSNIFLGS